MSARSERAEAILDACDLTPTKRGAASGEYRRTEDFADRVRYVAMTFLRRKMDGFGVQFYGADAVSRGSVFEDQLRTIGISRRGHRNNQLTLVCEVPWRGGDVDAAQLALLKWAAAGIVTGALARLDQ